MGVDRCVRAQRVAVALDLSFTTVPSPPSGQTIPASHERHRWAWDAVSNAVRRGIISCRMGSRTGERNQRLPRPMARPVAGDRPRRTAGLRDRLLHVGRGAADRGARLGRQGEPSPGADVAAVSPVPAQMWQRRAQSRRRCGSGERSPGAADQGAGFSEPRSRQPILHVLLSAGGYSLRLRCRLTVTSPRCTPIEY